MPSLPSSARLELVTTPTQEWLRKRLGECRTRLLVASPYINDGFLRLLRDVRPSVRRSLVTRTDLRDFALGSSNLNTLCTLSKGGVTIRALPDLHAKVYVLDNSWALVTSANATNAGLGKNWECGLATTDKATVRSVASAVLAGFGAPEPPRIKRLGALEAMLPQAKALRQSLPAITRLPVLEHAEAFGEEAVKLADANSFLDRFDGWTRLTLEAVLHMSKDTFVLAEMYEECAPAAAKQFPNNNTVQDQIRKQLQQLRDQGLVEFMGSGRYRRTIQA